MTFNEWVIRVGGEHRKLAEPFVASAREMRAFTSALHRAEQACAASLQQARYQVLKANGVPAFDAIDLVRNELSIT